MNVSELIAYKRYGHTGEHDLAATAILRHRAPAVSTPPDVTLDLVLKALFPTGHGPVADVAAVTRLWLAAHPPVAGQVTPDLH